MRRFVKRALALLLSVSMLGASSLSSYAAPQNDGGDGIGEGSGVWLHGESEEKISLDINLSEEDILSAALSALNAEPLRAALFTDIPAPENEWQEGLGEMEPPDDEESALLSYPIENDLPGAQESAAPAFSAELLSELREAAALFSGREELYEMPLPDSVRRELAAQEAGLALFLRKATASDALAGAEDISAEQLDKDSTEDFTGGTDRASRASETVYPETDFTLLRAVAAPSDAESALTGELPLYEESLKKLCPETAEAQPGAEPREGAVEAQPAAEPREGTEDAQRAQAYTEQAGRAEGEAETAAAGSDAYALTGEEEIYLVYVNARDGAAGKAIEFRLHVGGELHQTVLVEAGARVFESALRQGENKGATPSGATPKNAGRASGDVQPPAATQSDAVRSDVMRSDVMRPEAAGSGGAEPAALLPSLLSVLTRAFTLEVYAEGRDRRSTPGDASRAAVSAATPSSASAGGSAPASARIARTTLARLAPGLRFAPWTGSWLDAGLTPSANYIKLDPSNQTLINEADFGIGKKKQRSFAVKFAFSPDQISPESLKQDVAAEITIPSGFILQTMPAPVAGVSFQRRNNADGSTTLVAKVSSVGLSSAMSGALSVQQDANRLINELPTSHGEHVFDLKLFINYGTEASHANRRLLITDPADTECTARMTLKSETKVPTWTITNPSDSYTWMPGEICQSYSTAHPTGGRNIALYSADAHADESHTLLLGRASIKDPERKGFELKFHKDEGYLADGTAFRFVLPEEGDVFRHGGVLYWRFVADSGERTKRLRAGRPYNFGAAAPTDVFQGTLTLNGAQLYNRPDLLTGQDYGDSTDGTIDIGIMPVVEAGSGDGVPWAEMLYKAGTFELLYYPAVTYNKLYQGNWSATNTVTHTAAQGSTVTTQDNVTGASATAAGSPLRFVFSQGDQPVEIHSSYQYDLRPMSTTNANLPVTTQLPQYSVLSPEYSDSAELKAEFSFKDKNEGFQIQDDLSISYSFEDALSPVWLGELGTSSRFGFSYRIFITDAATGNLAEVRTIVAEDDYGSYTAQNFGAVTEQLIDGTGLTEWAFTDADTPGNTKYISKVELFKKEYEYSWRGSEGSRFSNNPANFPRPWFSYKLRAYHHRLANPATDIPDNYPAQIGRAVNSRQIQAQNGGPFTKSYTVQTVHLTDDLTAVASHVNEAQEVNTHDEITLLARYVIRKTAKTMKYNLNAAGNTIACGEGGYDPPVVEISGDALTVSEYLERDGQRILGVWGDDGNYYQLSDHGVNPENYLIDAVSKYSDTRETAFRHANGWYAPPFDGKLYDLKQLYAALGIHHATKLVAAADEVNSWEIIGSQYDKVVGLYVKHIAPGNLNYDSVVGTGGSADLAGSGKRLGLRVALYCQYSNYTREFIQHLGVHDPNGGTNHGTAKASSGLSSPLIIGDRAESISVVDEDYYVNPYSFTVDSRNDPFIRADETTELDPDRYRINVIAQGKQGWNYQANHYTDLENYRELELTRIHVDTPQTNAYYPMISYQDAELDFSGTDPRLLALTNTVSFNILAPRHWQHFGLEYTLSDGSTHSVEDIALHSNPSISGGHMHFQIPEVGGGVYLTALRVKFPNNRNWKLNAGKFSNRNDGDYRLPDVGLGRYGERIPAVYPGTATAVGTVSEHESDSSYDKLTVKAALRYKNIFGEVMTGDAAHFTAAGASERIATQQLEISALGTTSGNELSYGATNVQQGGILNVSFYPQFAPSFATVNLARANNMKIRPSYYFRIDKNFSYVDGSLKNNDRSWHPLSGTVATFVPAGTGPGQSGSADYGVLVVSMDETPESELEDFNTGVVMPTGSGHRAAYRHILQFQLQAGYSADPVNVKPVRDMYMDTAYDSNRDGSGAGNASGLPVETGDSDAQLSDGAPLGAVFGNLHSGKDKNGDGAAEMLHLPLSKTVKINFFNLQGMASRAIAKAPYQLSESQVTSRDLTAVENLFSSRFYLTGPEGNKSMDWELYVPVPKRGESYYYELSNEQKHTSPNQYAMDLLGVDTAGLGSLSFHVEYTSDPNPAAAAGYTGAKAADWSSAPPADLSAVTMVRVRVDEIPAGQKPYVELNYKLHGRKSAVGTQSDQLVAYVNARFPGETELHWGAKGQAGSVLSYRLEDMRVSGRVWEEGDWNSVYDAGTDTLLSGIKFYLRDPLTGTAVTNVTSNAAGSYSMPMPHDGNWTVSLDVPAGKRLVGQNEGTDPARNSVFDRSAERVSVSFQADPARNFYELKHINGGLYTAPAITIQDQRFHVAGAAQTFSGTLTHPVTGTSVLGYALAGGEPTDIAGIADNGDGSATATPQKTGAVKLKTSADDGYGDSITAESRVIVYADLRYDANGGSGSVSPNGAQLYPSVGALGADLHTDEAPLKSETGLSRPGYYFGGWNTRADGTGVDYQPGDSCKTGAVTADVTFYAVWKPATPAEDRIAVSKTVSGETPLAAESFQFRLSAVSAPSGVTAPMPAPAGAATAYDFQITGSGSVTLDALRFTVPGTYKYRIEELPGSTGGTSAGLPWGYSYDGTKYELSYTVTQSGGGSGNTLSAARVIRRTADGTEVPAVRFENPYSLPCYFVRFEKNDGSESGTAPHTQTVKHGDRANEPAPGDHTLEKEGHDLIGWTADGTTPYDFTTPVTGSLTLKPRWRIRTYPVTFQDSPQADGAHAGAVLKTETVNHGSGATPPASPQNRTGYLFDHWDGNYAHVTRAETVTAVYRPISYTVRYLGGGSNVSGSTPDSHHVYDTPSKLSANGFTRPGYYFAGWSTQAGAAVPIYSAGAPVLNLASVQDAVVTLYAVWSTAQPAQERLIVHKALSGEPPLGTESFRFTLRAAGSTAVGVTALPMPSAAGGAQSYSFSIAGAGNEMLGAMVFTQPGEYRYELREEPGSSYGYRAGQPYGYSYDASVYEIVFTVTQAGHALHAARAVTRDGSPAPALRFTNGYLRPRYEVRFDSNGGSAPPPDQLVRHGDSAAEPPASVIPTRTGYHFGGWSLNGAAYDFAAPVTGDITLRAIWHLRYYTVEFRDSPEADGAHAGALLQSGRVPHGGSAVPPGAPDNRRGYHFERWDGVYENVTEDRVLTAVYTPNHYYVAYRVNTPPGARDSGGGIDNDEFVWDVPGKLLHNRFYVKGCRFYGWALEPNGTRVYRNDEEILNLTDENGAVVVLYALWSNGESGGGGGGGKNSGIRGSGSSSGSGGGGSGGGPGVPKKTPVPETPVTPGLPEIPEAPATPEGPENPALPPEEHPQGAPCEAADERGLPRMAEKANTAIPVLLGLFAVAAAAYIVLRKKKRSAAAP
ncbi:MAG: InlB B-repeat-containing protein [Stomatobaculum sp.]